jgi:CheY-like chemotaxis protein
MRASWSIPFPLRIFIVEDHWDTLETLRLYLERLGHIVMSTRSKEEALKEIPGARCDVLLTDIGLPDGNGWELIEEVGESRPAYAIAMSGYGLPADLDRSAEAGFRHHLVKPISAKKVRLFIKRGSSRALV